MLRPGDPEGNEGDRVEWVPASLHNMSVIQAVTHSYLYCANCYQTLLWGPGLKKDKTHCSMELTAYGSQPDKKKNCKRHYCVPVHTLSALHILSSPPPYEVGTINKPNLQTRKLRHREVTWRSHGLEPMLPTITLCRKTNVSHILC